jgi:uncharacterized Zn-binding protein involved in type VI secretion
MPGQCKLMDISQTQGPGDAHGCLFCPHPALGPCIKGSPDVNVNSLPALRVGDKGVHVFCCTQNMWNTIKGSATVMINNQAAVRKDDPTQHCGGSGKMITGSANVITGD